jgi:hypothetical protein
MKAIRLEARREPEREKIRGVEFWVAVSPYYFPEQLACDYDANTGTYIIKFKYLDNEESVPSPKESDDLIGIEIGRHTGRLMAIRVHVDRHDLNRINMFVVDQIPKALEKASETRPDNAKNYRFAADAITSHASELVGCAANVSS